MRSWAAAVVVVSFAACSSSNPGEPAPQPEPGNPSPPSSSNPNPNPAPPPDQPQPPPCTPGTCTSAGATCGSVSNRCGGWLQCGACLDGQACVSGACRPAAGSGATRWLLLGKPYRGVSADTDGTLLVEDAHTFARLDPNGTELWRRDPPEDISRIVPGWDHEIALAVREDRLFGESFVYRYSPDGSSRVQIGHVASDDIGLFVPQVDRSSGRYLLVMEGGLAIFKLTLRSATNSDLWSLDHDWSNSVGIGAAFGPSGDVLIATQYRGKFTLLGRSGGTDGQTHLVVARISPAGAVAWMREHPCSDTLRVEGVGVTAIGTAVISGSQSGPLTIGSLRAGTEGVVTSFIAAFEANGDPRWLLETNLLDKALAVDPAGKAVVAGRARGMPTMQVAEWNLAGAPLWRRTVGGAQCQEVNANGIAYSNHQVVVSGDYQGACDFGPGQVTGAGESSGFLMNLGE